MAKYIWQELKNKYVLGDYKNLQDFAEREKIPYSVLRQRSKGWIEEKQTKQAQKANKIIDKTIERQVKKEVDYNQKHLDRWDDVGRFVNALFRDIDNLYYNGMVDDKKLKNLADVLEKVQKGQRLALGLDKDKDPNKDNDLNISVSFKDFSGGGGK